MVLYNNNMHNANICVRFVKKKQNIEIKIEYDILIKVIYKIRQKARNEEE